MNPLRTWTACLALALACGCSHEKRTVFVGDPPAPAPVEIEVEVFDPVTNGVWEDVGVRIVEAWNEWSGRTVGTSRPGMFELTDRFGLVYFSPERIAEYDVGFAENVSGQALLGPEHSRDEAVVTLEIFAEGFQTVIVDVRLSWDQPYAFISVPFE